MDWKLAALFLGVAVVSAAFGLAVALLWRRQPGEPARYKLAFGYTEDDGLGVTVEVEMEGGVPTQAAVEVVPVGADVTAEKYAARSLGVVVPLEVQS
jgi:hypothetical protein